MAAPSTVTVAPGGLERRSAEPLVGAARVRASFTCDDGASEVRTTDSVFGSYPFSSAFTSWLPRSSPVTSTGATPRGAPSTATVAPAGSLPTRTRPDALAAAAAGTVVGAGAAAPARGGGGRPLAPGGAGRRPGEGAPPPPPPPGR